MNLTNNAVVGDSDRMPHPTGHAVTVLGSANLDLVFLVDRIPQPGETMLANSGQRHPGGKGLNQAVAAARAGATTNFIGALGLDDAGELLAGTMADANIVSGQLRRQSIATGQAFIVVENSGENTIVVASGANATVETLTVEDASTIAASRVLLMQLELPVSVVTDAARQAHAAGVIVMLNAAPARALSSQLLNNLDYLIVNEHEACLIAGISDLFEASAKLSALVPQLVVTLGAAGSVLFVDGTELTRVGAPRVTAIDTTGAGDTFCGAFAAAIAEGATFEDSARFATAAAALSVQQIGAVTSVPMRVAIDAALAKSGYSAIT